MVLIKSLSENLPELSGKNSEKYIKELLHYIFMIKMNKAERMKALEELNRICSKSKLTEKDALELGAKINRGMAKRYLEMEKEMRHAKNSS